MENDKEIEMFQISDSAQVGTEIFDPSLPSNLDFDENEANQNQKSFINPEKKGSIPAIGKSILIGPEMKAYRIKGSMTKEYEPMMVLNGIINHAVHTHPVKILDQKSSGIKKIWESLVGYCKRQIMLYEGYIYFLERKGNDLRLVSCIPLATLFKLFVDPEDEKIRLVVKTDNHLTNVDIKAENFLFVTGMISQELNNCGLALSQ